MKLTRNEYLLVLNKRRRELVDALESEILSVTLDEIVEHLEEFLDDINFVRNLFKASE